GPSWNFSGTLASWCASSIVPRDLCPHVRSLMFRAIRISLAVVLLSLPIRAQQLELRFLDVGQGDAIVIREGGKTALVDSGRSARIMLQIDELGIDAIDLLVATHNQADHIGGMPAVLSSTGVRYYLDNGVPHDTSI